MRPRTFSMASRNRRATAPPAAMATPRTFKTAALALRKIELYCARLLGDCSKVGSVPSRGALRRKNSAVSCSVLVPTRVCPGVGMGGKAVMTYDGGLSGTAAA